MAFIIGGRAETRSPDGTARGRLLEIACLSRYDKLMWALADNLRAHLSSPMKLRSIFLGALVCAVAGLSTPARAGTITALHSFGGAGGSAPNGALVSDSVGAFYGTTLRGGANDSGTVFRLALDGTFTLLHEFGGTGDGSRPYAGLVDGKDGFFYGTTALGGTNNHGTIYRVSAAGDLSILVNLDSATTGGQPRAGLILGSDGSLYGTNYAGGDNNLGNVFRVTRDGVLTVLGSFDATTGTGSISALVENRAGVFYGTAALGAANNKGAIFKFAADGSGVTVVHTFSAVSAQSANVDGAEPFGGLAVASDGTLYGATNSGGTNGLGTIFCVSPAGVFTTLVSLDSANTGALPYAGLTYASDGNLYGITSTGTGNGNIFQYSPQFGYTVLASLDFATTGATSYANLIEGPDNALYGLASVGGTGGDGTVYRLPLPGPHVTVAATVPKVISGGGQAGQFVVSIPQPLAQTFVVHFTVKGSAVAGTDYEPLLGKVKIKPGHTSRGISVVTTGTHSGVAKAVKVVLTPDDSYLVSTVGPAKVKIVP